MENKEIKKNEYVHAKKSKIHNTGIFAKKFIQKGTLIIEYIGEKISKKESERRADQVLEDSKKNKEKGAVYIFEINKKYDLDGNVPYNIARFINHSCNPNCESEIINEEIWIKAIKDIKPGEELKYNYGYDVDNFEEHPCRCGSKKCKGYIASEDNWKKLKNLLRKNFKNKKVLIAYYSRTGNTKKVAEYLAENMGFDVDEITTDKRDGIIGYLKRGYESASNKKSRISFNKNPESYDLVIIGTPIWAYNISSPIRTYLVLCKNVNVAAFCTMSGKDHGNAFKEISQNIKSFKGLLNINEKTIKNNTFQHDLLEFFRKIEL
ncbi:SET domain-containing protein-lysine N-methyltransferase [Candidatus Woesearchaeota archaeon]|nr:SET domain-containing protein-lysine N-methyltransferase [Candidatus Woesearchaeota archaeon]